MVRHKVKRSVHDIPSLPEEELIRRIQTMEEPYKSYAAFCYLFGNRVSEALGVRNSEFYANYVYYRDVKRRDAEGKQYIDRRPYYHAIYKETEGWKIPPLEPWRIKFHKDGIIEVTDMLVLKTRKLTRKNKYVYAYGPGETQLAEILRQYVQDYLSPESTVLWGFRRQQAYRKFSEHLGIPPHKLREMRATKDAVVYGLDAIELKEKHAWVDARMPLYYASKAQKDIVGKLKQGQPTQ
jgi:integrase